VVSSIESPSSPCCNYLFSISVLISLEFAGTAIKLHNRSVPPATLPHTNISRYPIQRTAYRFSNVFDLFVHCWIEMFFPIIFVDIPSSFQSLLFTFCFCSTVYVKALFIVNVGAGFTPTLPKTSQFRRMAYATRDVRHERHDGRSTGQYGGPRTLRPSTNNFKGSDLNNLIVVPAPVPTSAMGVVGWRGRESRGCFSELRCNLRKSRGGFTLEVRFSFSPREDIRPKRLPPWVPMDGEDPRLLIHH